VAEAWLSRPRAYRGALRAVAPALEDDETPQTVFRVFLGSSLGGRSGLLFVTDRALIRVTRRAFHRQIVRIAFGEIREHRKQLRSVHEHVEAALALWHSSDRPA